LADPGRSGDRPATRLAATIEPALVPMNRRHRRTSAPVASSYPARTPVIHATPSSPPPPSTRTFGGLSSNGAIKGSSAVATFASGLASGVPACERSSPPRGSTRRLPSVALEQHRDALAAADAEGNQPELVVLAFHLAQILVVRITPVAAIGWPRAIAPPFGLTFAGSRSRSLRTASDWAANASLSSITSTSSSVYRHAREPCGRRGRGRSPSSWAPRRTPRRKGCGPAPARPAPAPGPPT